MRVAAVWSFDAIAAVEHARAVRLQAAPPWQSIHTSVVQRFGEELQTGRVRFGLEQASERPVWLRAFCSIQRRRGAAGLVLQCANGLSRTVSPELAKRVAYERGSYWRSEIAPCSTAKCFLALSAALAILQ
jgi:hypothetical protein